MTKAKKIKLIDQQQLRIEWDDGAVHSIPLKYLRDESPDAGNKGETILWKHYAPPAQGPDKPGKYEIESIEKVGNYAIQITWKDGHDHGIYSWELLRTWGELFEVKNAIKNENQ